MAFRGVTAVGMGVVLASDRPDCRRRSGTFVFQTPQLPSAVASRTGITTSTALGGRPIRPPWIEICRRLIVRGCRRCACCCTSTPPRARGRCRSTSGLPLTWACVGAPAGVLVPIRAPGCGAGRRPGGSRRCRSSRRRAGPRSRCGPGGRRGAAGRPESLAVSPDSARIEASEGLHTGASLLLKTVAPPCSRPK